jgi:hypothetical protein
MTLKRSEILVSAAVLAVGGMIFLLESRALRTARAQNEALRQQISQLTEQIQEQQRRSVASPPRRKDALRELERLRGEAGARHPTEQLAKLQEQNRRLQIATEEPADPVEAEFKAQTLGHVNNLKVWGLDFHIYASQHDGQFPESWEQALAVSQKRASMKDPAAFDAYMNELTNHFELVYRGALSAIPKPGETLVFMEKQARLSPKGEWVKVYGFADGSVQVRAQPEEDFKAWEQQHVFKPR